MKDLIEILFRWDDTNFHIIFEKKHKKWRGCQSWNDMSREHEVSLFHENIVRDFERGHVIGGSQKASTLKIAEAQVLAHELQHCNQQRLHKNTADSTFFNGHRYWNLASEREARGFVDERLNEIYAYFDATPIMRRAPAVSECDTGDELDEVITLLAECDSVTPEDVNDELRASKILKPANVIYVKQALIARGVEIKKKEKQYFR